MRIRLVSQVFVRHLADESMVICPRTGGCTVMKDAKPIMEKLGIEWRRIGDVVFEVAKEIGCNPDDVSEDVYVILDELYSQGFVDWEGKIEGSRVADAMTTAVCVHGGLVSDTCHTPYMEFCQRHNMLAELHMDLTDRCNESCVHCYIPKGVWSMMPTDMAMKVLRDFRAIEGLTVFVSGGEPMLHPDFAMILLEAKRLGLNIIVMSNLTLCDAKMVTFLKEIDPQFVNVSLYSMKSEEHDTITRVPGSWTKTMAAIRALKEAGVHVRLATPVMRENRDAVDGLQNFAREMQMHDVIDCDIFGRMNHDCSNQSHALGLDEAEDVIRKYKDQLCHQELGTERCAPDAKVCDIGEVKLNINARGDYYPCDGGHGIVLGNAAADSLADVWKGEKLNNLRALKNRDFPKCVGCANRAWCKVCVMRNFNETGDLFTPAPERCARAAIHRKIWEEK